MQINLPLLPEKGKRTFLYIGLGVLVVAGLLFAYKSFFYKPPATGIYSVAKPADGMNGAPTHTTPPVKLQAYDKETAVKKMKIPEIILSDPKLELVGTGKVKPSEGGYTIGAVTNTETGKTEIITKEEARTLFGFGGKSELAIGADLSTRTGLTGVFEGRQDLLRIGSMVIVGKGEVRVSPEQIKEPFELIGGARAVWRW